MSQINRYLLKQYILKNKNKKQPLSVKQPTKNNTLNYESTVADQFDPQLVASVNQQLQEIQVDDNDNLIVENSQLESIEVNQNTDKPTTQLSNNNVESKLNDFVVENQEQNLSDLFSDNQFKDNEQTVVVEDNFSEWELSQKQLEVSNELTGEETTKKVNVQENGVAYDSISKKKKPKLKILNSRKNFNFAEFEKNVKYKEFANGEKKKIAAEIQNIRLTYTNPSKPEEKALVLRNTSIQFYEGEVHAIIGESGSGKSVITSLLYGLAGKNANVEEGKILLYNNEVQDFRFKDWERSRYLGKVISAVFQNPMSTLNPTMKIGKQIMEGMLINGIVKNRKEAYKQAIEYLKLTKINNPEEVMELYPHELSGGMIQRVVIASIVSLHPKILVLDEPTTALDPTVQALVLDIIRELQEKFKMCVIFITHDLGVVASISNYISIMYAGQIIEEGTREEVLWNPQHPYTWGLILSMPDVNKGDRLSTIKGSVPSRLNSIVGDAFAIRNDYALTRDFTVEPDMYYVSETHRAKTALLDKRAPAYEPPAIIKEKWAVFKSKNQTSKGE